MNADPTVNPFALLGEKASAAKPCHQPTPVPCKFSRVLSALVQEGEAALESEMEEATTRGVVASSISLSKAASFDVRMRLL